MGACVISFDEGSGRQAPEGRLCKEFFLALPVVQAEAVVRRGQDETALHGIHGAVKNLYGSIPGTLKAKYHLRYQGKEEFGLMLLDLLAAVKPRCLSGCRCGDGW